jgi:hypothetical protein
LTIKQLFLGSHNYLRCIHGQEPVQWDDEIENNALDLAKQMDTMDKMKHSDSYPLCPSVSPNQAHCFQSHHPIVQAPDHGCNVSNCDFQERAV